MATSHGTVTPSHHLQKIIRILSKPQTERSPVDKRLLLELTQDIKFFQQYEGHPFVHENCCCYMQYEFHQEGDTVFEIDTVGNKFYIILEGTVGVYIQNECQDNITSEFIISDYPSNGNLNCVKCLGKGSSFGELALLYDSPRMASIICHSDCHFAVLPKKEFLRVMKNEQKDKLNKNLQYLSGLIVFSKINQQLLRQIYSKAFYISTTKDQYVYKQGQLTEHFYIVRAGEFAVKKHSIEEEELLTNQLKDDKNHTGIRKVSCIEKNLALFGPLAKKNKQHDLQLSLLVEPDYFGEEDILWGNSKRSFSVQCVTAEGEVIMVQKQLFLQILSSLHTRQFIEQHLAIKEKQFYQRIENAKIQFEKFKGYLLEDRKGGWQERQDSKERQEKLEKEEKEERKNIAKVQQQKQQLHDQNSLNSMKDTEHQLSRQDLRDKNIILQNTQVIDAESQRVLEEKIIRFIQERYTEVSSNRKAQLPTLQEIKDHNQKHQEALKMNKSSHFIRFPQEKKIQLTQSQESSFTGGTSSVASSSRPQSSLLSQLQRQLLKHSAAQMTDSFNFNKPDQHFVSALSSYFHKNSSQNTMSQLANDTDTQPFMCSSLSVIKMQQQQSQNQPVLSTFEPPQFQETDILQQSPEFVIRTPNSIKRKTSIKISEETKRDSKGMLNLSQERHGRLQEKTMQVSYNQSFERNDSMNLNSNLSTKPIDSACPQNLRSQSLKCGNSRRYQQVNSSNSPQQRFLEQIMNRRLVKKPNVSTAAAAQHASELNGSKEKVKQSFLIQNSGNSYNNTNTFYKTTSTKNLSITAGTTATSSFAGTITSDSSKNKQFQRRESLQPLHSLSNSRYFASSQSQIKVPASLSPARSCVKMNNKFNNINNGSLQIKSSQFYNSANRLDTNTLEHSKSFMLTPLKAELQSFLDTSNNSSKIAHHGSQSLAQSIFATQKTSNNEIMMTAPDMIRSPVPQKMSIRFYNIFKKNQK